MGTAGSGGSDALFEYGVDSMVSDECTGPNENTSSSTNNARHDDGHNGNDDDDDFIIYNILNKLSNSNGGLGNARLLLSNL